MKVFNIDITIKLHKFLKQNLNLPYHLIQKLCRQGRVLLNDRKISSKPQDYQMNLGDKVTINSADVIIYKKKIIPTNLKPQIIYKNKDLFIINKCAGIASQGGKYLNDLNYANFAKEHGLYPIHRLDFYTTGIMIFAKNITMAQILSQKMAQKKIDKYYLAYIKYPLKSAVRVNSVIDDKEAISYFLPISPNVVLIRIISGKKHQIRKHLLLLQNQLVYDTKYSLLNNNKYVNHINQNNNLSQSNTDNTPQALTHKQLLNFINILNKTIVLYPNNNQEITYLRQYLPAYDEHSCLQLYIQNKVLQQKHVFLHHVVCKIPYIDSNLLLTADY